MKKKKISSGNLIVGLIIVLILIGLQTTTRVFAPDPEHDAWGKIIQPVEGGRATTKMTVVGETQDIASGNHIWIAVDSLDKKKCRPRKMVLRNTRFRTRINLETTAKKFRLSIYLLDEALHDQWQAWVEKKMTDGLPSPQGAILLDSVKLNKY